FAWAYLYHLLAELSGVPDGRGSRLAAWLYGVGAAGLVVMFFVAGAHSVPRRYAVHLPAWQIDAPVAAPFVGLLAPAPAWVAVALLSPLAVLDDELFWVHMVQHELFIFAAPPLFLAGAIPFLTPRALPTVVGRLVRPLTRPLVALSCSTAVLWLWHAPTAYDLAL